MRLLSGGAELSCYNPATSTNDPEVRSGTHLWAEVLAARDWRSSLVPVDWSVDEIHRAKAAGTAQLQQRSGGLLNKSRLQRFEDGYCRRGSATLLLDARVRARHGVL